MKNKKTQKITLSLQKDTIKTIKKYAKQENRTMSATVDLAIEAYETPTQKIKKIKQAAYMKGITTI